MDYLKRSNPQLNPQPHTSFNCFGKSVLSVSEPVMIPSLKPPLLGDYSFAKLAGQISPYPKFSQPPVIVGGVVGSKICVLKNGTGYNLLGDLIQMLTSLPIPSSNNEHRSYRKQFPSATTTIVNPQAKSFAQVLTPTKSDIPLSSATVLVSPVVVAAPIPMSPPISITKESSPRQAPSLATCRTLSESSETSWASVDPPECDAANLKTTNPWLNDLLGSVSQDDGDDEDENSDWGSVDFQSENGEIVNDFKWNGEAISPIPSPICATPPALPVETLLDYDSDESDGILISCGSYDDEEEARERRLAQERIQAANDRWEDGLLSTDETDGPRLQAQTKQKKEVNNTLNIFIFRSYQ